MEIKKIVDVISKGGEILISYKANPCKTSKGDPYDIKRYITGVYTISNDNAIKRKGIRYNDYIRVWLEGCEGVFLFARNKVYLRVCYTDKIPTEQYLLNNKKISRDKLREYKLINKDIKQNANYVNICTNDIISIESI